MPVALISKLSTSRQNQPMAPQQVIGNVQCVQQSSSQSLPRSRSIQHVVSKAISSAIATAKFQLQWNPRSQNPNTTAAGNLRIEAYLAPRTARSRTAARGSLWAVFCSTTARSTGRTVRKNGPATATRPTISVSSRQRKKCIAILKPARKIKRQPLLENSSVTTSTVFAEILPTLSNG